MAIMGKNEKHENVVSYKFPVYLNGSLMGVGEVPKGLNLILLLNVLDVLCSPLNYDMQFSGKGDSKGG